MSITRLFSFTFFFFNDTATTEIYTLSLHDALPIWGERSGCPSARRASPSRSTFGRRPNAPRPRSEDRKSTRLNSSHLVISYAVFCLKKKKKNARLRRFTARVKNRYRISSPRLTEHS